MCGIPAIDDSWPLRQRHSSGYRETLTLPRGPGPWPTPHAGTSTAAPTPVFATVRALRGSWPAPATPTSAVGARNFPQNNRHLHGDQGPRSATHPANNACSGSQCTGVTWRNINEEDRLLLDPQPDFLGLAAQGAQLLLGQVPGAPLLFRLSEAPQFEAGTSVTVSLW